MCDNCQKLQWTIDQLSAQIEQHKCELAETVSKLSRIEKLYERGTEYIDKLHQRVHELSKQTKQNNEPQSSHSVETVSTEAQTELDFTEPIAENVPILKGVILVDNEAQTDWDLSDLVQELQESASAPEQTCSGVSALPVADDGSHDQTRVETDMGPVTALGQTEICVDQQAGTLGTQSDGSSMNVDVSDAKLASWLTAPEAAEEGEIVQKEPLSIAEIVREAAEAAQQQTAYVYDSTTGLYYDSQTGYYYDAEKGLHYDSYSGTYYYYNTETSSYEYHSRVDLAQLSAQQQQCRTQPGPRGSPERPDPATAWNRDNQSDVIKRKRKKQTLEEEKDRKHKHLKQSKSDRHKSSRSEKEKTSRKISKKSSRKHKKGRRDDRSPDGRSPDDRSPDDHSPDDRSPDADKYEVMRDIQTDVRQSPEPDEIDSEEYVPNVRESHNPSQSHDPDMTLHKSAKVGHDVLVIEDSDEGLSERIEPAVRIKEEMCEQNISKAATNKKYKLLPRIKQEGSVGECGGRVKVEKDLTHGDSSAVSLSHGMQNDTVVKLERPDVTVGQDTGSHVSCCPEISEGEYESPPETDAPERVPVTRSETTDKKPSIHEMDLSRRYPEKLTTSKSENLDRRVRKRNMLCKNSRSVSPVIPIKTERSSPHRSRSSSKKALREKDAHKRRGKHKKRKSDTDERSHRRLRSRERKRDTYRSHKSSSSRKTKRRKSTHRDTSYRRHGSDSKKRRSRDDKQTSHDAGEQEMEEGELMTDSSSTEYDSDSTSSDSSSSSESELCSSHYDSCPGDDGMETEEISPLSYPPCIRAIVTESSVLDEGSLFIILYTGATIGRAKELNHGILIDEVIVSKMHCDVQYNQSVQQYEVKDHASQGGTYVNGQRLSNAKVVSEPHPITHLDKLTVGGSTLELHIHPGTDTCDACEPGLVMAKIQEQRKLEQDAVVSAPDKEKLRRQQLRQIRKKYGLEQAPYAAEGAVSNPAYADKAEERRRTVGSDNPYQKEDMPSSVHQEISTKNKGHKMLAKMGWKHGDSLGKSQTGIKEPIQVSIRSNQSAGLGSQATCTKSLDDVRTIQRSQHWIKAQQRFHKMQKQQAGNVSLPPQNTKVKRMQFIQGDTETFHEHDLQSPCQSESATRDEGCVGDAPNDEMESDVIKPQIRFSAQTTKTAIGNISWVKKKTGSRVVGAGGALTSVFGAESSSEEDDKK